MTYTAERKAATISDGRAPLKTSHRRLLQDKGYAEGTLPALAFRGVQQRAAPA